MLRSAHFVARPSIVSQLNVNDGWPPAAIQWRFGKSKRVKEDEEEEKDKEEEEEKKDKEEEEKMTRRRRRRRTKKEKKVEEKL